LFGQAVATLPVRRHGVTNQPSGKPALSRAVQLLMGRRQNGVFLEVWNIVKVNLVERPGQVNEQLVAFNVLDRRRADAVPRSMGLCNRSSLSSRRKV
jgi:hypothetical protein